MKTDSLSLAFAYLRLSREEAQAGESSSITNQRMIVQRYCEQNKITIVREFSDDGFSGGNFDRPGFQEMMRQLEKGYANIVITKDLSRLGRDMREASYYAEQFFPENGIRYIAIADNFDTEHENIMAPFQFAMNEVYLRDGSKKVRDVLKNKRESGQYCCCPPYGYKKDPEDKHHLIPDEVTAPVVLRIFQAAQAGDSSHKIAVDLNQDGIIPPLKYRVLYRDNFTEDGAAHASDLWNHTTVKRILKNEVYLGHTILGKSKKASVKSKKKIAVPKDSWAVTQNTHPAIVTQDLFNAAQKNLATGSKNYTQYNQVRKSIFSGIAFCELCGHALCSCGTVYKGEREKYWYLACNHQRQDLPDPCTGARIYYADLVELVRNDINSFISMTDEQMRKMTETIIGRIDGKEARKKRASRLKTSMDRLETIDKIITKLYYDNASGKISDERLYAMVGDFEKEASGLKDTIQELSKQNVGQEVADHIDMFFNLVKQHTEIETLDRETLLCFVDRIEVGPKVFPEGKTKATHKNTKYHQKVRIFYKFIGDPTNI